MINANITGPQGPQGEAGAQGPQGNQGAEGYQGSAGVTGNQGPQGVQGAQGANGAQGAQGNLGFPGTNAAGSTYVSSVGDSTVSLLLHMEGANNSTTFTDSTNTPRTVTAYGNAKISTTEYKFGSSSADFDGNGDYLRIPYDAGFDLSSVNSNGASANANANSTIEGWVNPRVTSAQTIISKGQSGFDYNFELRIHNSTTLRFVGHYGAVDVAVPTITTGTWHHFAVVGVPSAGGSGTLYFFWNGVLRGTSAQTIWNYSSMDLTIGCSSYNSPSVFFNGYIDEIRITKGTARYTSDFTPSSSAFPSANGSVELVATYVGQTVYSSDGIYICSSLSPLTWKKYPIVPTTLSS